MQGVEITSSSAGSCAARRWASRSWKPWSPAREARRTSTLKSTQPLRHPPLRRRIHGCIRPLTETRGWLRLRGPDDLLMHEIMSLVALGASRSGSCSGSWPSACSCRSGVLNFPDLTGRWQLPAGRRGGGDADRPRHRSLCRRRRSPIFAGALAGPADRLPQPALRDPASCRASILTMIAPLFDQLAGSWAGPTWRCSGSTTTLYAVPGPRPAPTSI